jgi:xylose dehydrogenase (NAD/NADP)
VIVRWGLMSTARINGLFLAGVRQAEGVEVVAVASRDRGRADAYAREHAIDRVHGSYEALLADPGVDAVYIPLPNSMHVEWSVRALEAGKHVLCEKPLSRSASEVERAFDVAEREGRLLMEAFMYRHNPQTHRLSQLLAEGAVGRVRLIRAAFSFVARDPADVRLAQGLDGGALMDVGCYCVNGTRLLGGEPERVSAFQVLGGDDVDVSFAGVLELPGGVLGHFDCGLSFAARDELEVVGDEGSLFLDDPWHCRAPVIELRIEGGVERIEGGVERIELERVDSYRLEAENFSAATLGEAEPLLGRADAVAQARAIEALSPRRPLAEDRQGGPP